MRNSIIFLLACLFSVVAWGAPKLHYYSLDNGLQVILSVNNNVAVVNQTLWYRVGSQDEALGKSGMAHILEHLMFKGTQTHKDGFSHIVSRLGGVENAATSRYYTNYYQTVPAEHWHELAALEAGRMTDLQFDESEMLTEIDVVYEERLSRVDNNPQSLLSERALRTLFANHPYGNPIAGWGEEILAHKGDLLGFADFYKRYYRPNNAILTVSGDINLDDAKQVIENTYGKIPASPATEQTDIFEPHLPSGKLQHTINLSHPNVSQEILMLMKAAPSVGYNNNSDERKIFKQSDILPLMIISDILNSPDFSLREDLVQRQKLALGVGSHYSAMGRGPGIFYLYLVPKKDADLAEVQKILHDKLLSVADKGFTESQIEQAKIRILDSLLLSYDSLSFYPNLAAQALISGLTMDEFLSWSDDLSSVQTTQVNDTLRHFFSGKITGVWASLERE